MLLLPLLFSLLLSPEPARLTAGPMLGHVDIVQASIWLQTSAACQLQLRYWPLADPKQVLVTEPQTPGPETEFSTSFSVGNLAENTAYGYQVYLDGNPLSFPYPTQFKTQALWRWRTDPPPIKIAFGSCLYVNDSAYDRPGKPYGVNFDTLGQIVAQKPDLMLWLGDNTYLRESEFFVKQRMAYRYRHTRSFAPLQPLLAACPNYAIWDDHDYGPNDSDRSFPLKNETLHLFKTYWRNPSFGMPDTPGVFGLVNWGDIDFFMLDNRYYRAPQNLKDPNRPHFGEAQLQWLKDSLSYSTAPFKFIVSGGQILNIYNQDEALPHHRKEYQELLAHLEDQKVKGVIFLTGDRHFAELLKVVRPASYPLYEFTSSSLSSGLGRVKGPEVDHPMRVPGTLVIDKQNFGLLEVSGPQGDRVLVMKAMDMDGATRWEYKVSEKELQ